MWRIVASALVGLAGCDRAFDFTLPAGDAAVDAGTDAESNACAALPFDPVRYGVLTTDNGRSWTHARTACAMRGSDLAVLDLGDGAELANQSAGAPVPFWLGVSFGDDWAAIDGCAPALTWAAGEPAQAEPGTCVLVTADGMATERCTATSHLGEAIDALCETPRLDPACLALVANSQYTVVSGLLSQPLAQDACAAQGAHLLELNSSAELAHVLQDVAPNTPSFWLAAEYDGAAWSSPTTCPQVFPWQATEPMLDDEYLRCSLYEDAGMKSEYCNSRTAAVICETNTP